ncbi:receptor-like protein EIX1 [Vicia villosa]|uniref:receptor-like protein EIX1 n=1 Tax=Vicia villosa TaxID=3911 RepID=UPI00273AE197|nr:receptor-like protein EIX1 [Vicia villosa]
MIFLQYLDLSNNELQGSIPNSFKSMRQLNGLILNSLPNLSCFSSLLVLSLHNTNLVGLVPKWYFHSLVNLDLSHNNLSAVDIIDDANPPSIIDLDLSFNRFECCGYHSLRSLSLSSNKLNGMINETHLSNLSELTLLDVSQNSLSFNMSSHWIPPFKLENLYVSSCQLGPEFPVWLKHQTELSDLDISNAGISDSFPKWFYYLFSRMVSLNVSHNKLYGPLPKSPPRTEDEYVTGADHVRDFRFNNLSGSLPALSNSTVSRESFHHFATPVYHLVNICSIWNVVEF